MPNESQVNTLDEIMDRDPLSLSSADLDTIIAYQRKYRANLEAGGPKLKRGQVKPGAKIDLASLGLKPKPVVTAIKRRI